MTLDRKRRLAALEASLLRPQFKPFPEAAATALLKWILDSHAAVAAGKACPVPRTYEPTPDTPAKAAVHAMLDRVADRLAGRVDAARSERRKAKRERRAARRAAAVARAPEPAPATNTPKASQRQP